MKKRLKKAAVCLTACSMLVGGVTVPVNAQGNDQQSIENQVEEPEEQSTAEASSEENQKGQRPERVTEENATVEASSEENQKGQRPERVTEENATVEASSEENQKGQRPERVTEEKVTTQKETTQEKTEEEKVAKKTKVTKVTCTSDGKVTISFKNKVSYTDEASAIITAEDGTEIACTISKQNKRAMVMTAEGLVQGQKYTLTVSGIIVEDSTEATTITKTFTVKGMKTKNRIVKTTANSDADTVTIKMSAATFYKEATVEVTDTEGEELDATIVKKTRNAIKVKVEGLEKGEKYKVTINGVKTKKEKNYSTVTKTVKAK